MFRGEYLIVCEEKHTIGGDFETLMMSLIQS